MEQELIRNLEPQGINNIGEIEYYQPTVYDQAPQGGGGGSSINRFDEVPMPTLKDEVMVVNPEFTTPILSQNMLIAPQPQLQPEPTKNTNTVYETIAGLNSNTHEILGAETSVLNTGLTIPTTGWKVYLPYIFAIIGIALTIYSLTKKNKKY